MNGTRNMTGNERGALLSLAFAYGLRMLGLYLAMPVLSPYAASLRAGGSFWVGMAVGGYGITQGIFQLPFGSLSDHFGRKSALLTGLVLFVIGSLVAAVAETAPVLVIGRMIQGAGAISSVIVATVADLAPDAIRQRAMTMLGAIIAATFAMGVLGGPILAEHISIPGLFYMSAAMGVLSIVALVFLVPEPPVRHSAPRPTFREILAVFHDSILLRINLAMFALHLSTTALFVILPLRVEEFWPREDAWRVYGPAIGAGMVAMWLAAEWIDRHRVDRPVLIVGAVCLTAGSLALRFGLDGKPGIFWGLFLFVVGFALIEPILPALVTRYTSVTVRGTAAGAFSMSQFFGAGIGGVTAAFFLARSASHLFWVLAGLSAGILLLAVVLPDPRSESG